MTSFCHYAFGVVGQWMYRHILGIQPSEEDPGYRHIVIHPIPGDGLTWTRKSYDSMVGRIETSWSLEGGLYRLEISLPPNTTVAVWVRTDDPETAEVEPMIEKRTPDKGLTVFEAGSGRYRFSAYL